MHLLLYDGSCGLCSRVVQAVLARDRRAVFRYASLQGPVGRAELARHGLPSGRLDTFVVIPDHDRGSSPPLVRSRAALFIAVALGWPWRGLSALGVLPTSWLDRGYDIVARNRHRVFPPDSYCLRPRPEHRDRFLDGGSLP